MVGEGPAGAPASIQLAVLSSAALVIFQGVLLVGAAVFSIGASPTVEVVLAIVLGLAVFVTVPMCITALRRGRPRALPVFFFVLGVFAATGVLRTISDPSVGSVAMIVLCAVTAALLALPASLRWVAAVAAIQRTAD